MFRKDRQEGLGVERRGGCILVAVKQHIKAERAVELRSYQRLIVSIYGLEYTQGLVCLYL